MTGWSLKNCYKQRHYHAYPQNKIINTNTYSHRHYSTYLLPQTLLNLPHDRMVIENMLQAETVPCLPPKQDYQHKYLLPQQDYQWKATNLKRQYQTYPPDMNINTEGDNRSTCKRVHPHEGHLLSMTLLNCFSCQLYAVLHSVSENNNMMLLQYGTTFLHNVSERHMPYAMLMIAQNMLIAWNTTARQIGPLKKKIIFTFIDPLLRTITI